MIDHRPNDPRPLDTLGRRGLTFLHLPDEISQKRETFEHAEMQNPGAQSVIEIVVQIRDLVRSVRHLTLEAPLVEKFRKPDRVGPMAAVLEDSLTGLVAQVQTAIFDLPLLEEIHHPEALPVVIESARRREHLGQDALPGMAKGRMSQVMGQADGLRQILVESQHPGNGARNLRPFEGMGQTVSIVIALVMDKYLGLVLEAPKSPGVNHSVSITLKSRAKRMLLFRMKATSGGCASGRYRRQGPTLPLFLDNPAAIDLGWAGPSGSHLEESSAESASRRISRSA